MSSKAGCHQRRNDMIGRTGLTTKVLFIDTEGNVLSVTIGDELLQQLAGNDVLSLDKDSLAEKLLFIENVSIMYDKKRSTLGP